MPGRIARNTVRALLVAFALGTSSGCENLEGKRCPDEDYPLRCEENKACCPKGKPFNCGGMCYETREDAVRSCGARIDTCYRE